MSKIYGKVENGKIVEYPVFEEHIRNRSHPFAWYTEVVYDTEPTVAIDEYAKEVLTVGKDVINCSYTVEKMSLQALLALANRGNNAPLGIDNSGSKILVKDIDPLLVESIISKVLDYASTKLEYFVKLRGYDSVLSAISYKDSLVDQYKSEANQVITMRDTLWSTLITYSTDIKSGKVDFPVSTLDVDKVIGKFTFVDATQPAVTPTPAA
jgi:hypothetical protein